MNSKQITPTQQNGIADLALKAAILNVISWLPAAVPGALLASWSIILVVSIPLSAVIALVAGRWGLLKVKAAHTGLWQSLTGVIIGLLNILAIIYLILVIYALRKSGIWGG